MVPGLAPGIGEVVLENGLTAGGAFPPGVASQALALGLQVDDVRHVLPGGASHLVQAVIQAQGIGNLGEEIQAVLPVVQVAQGPQLGGPHPEAHGRKAQPGNFQEIAEGEQDGAAADQQQADDGPPGRETQPEQAVVEMEIVSHENGSPAPVPADNGGAGVPDGHHHGGQQHGKVDAHLLAEIQGQAPQDQAHPHAARVAQEDLPAADVPVEEGHGGAAKGGREEHAVHLAHRQGDDRQGQGAQDAQAAGQAVQAVDEVHAVDEAKVPEKGHRPGPAPQVDGAHQGQDHGVQTLTEQHEHDDDHQLAVQLLLRMDPEPVVAHAQGQDGQAGAAEDSQPGPGQRRVQDGVLQEEKGAEEGDEDGHAPGAGNGLTMGPAIAGMVHDFSEETQIAEMRLDKP